MSEERIGVYVCCCGTNIANVVDVESVAEEMKDLQGVAITSTYKYMCSNPGQQMITDDIKEHNLTRVVVSACSPRMHENTFRKALGRGGVNPYMLEMANIREQCSWIHTDKVAATAKAKDLVRGAIQRVKYHDSLDSRTAQMNPATLVLGGGIAGLSAALELAESGQQVYLIERADRLGGNMARIDLTAPYLDSGRDIMKDRIARVTRHQNIRVLLQSELLELKGFLGNFTAKVVTKAGEEEIEIGSVVICTGFKEFDASRIKPYGYGTLPDVITSSELEGMLRKGNVVTKSGKRPRYVTILHCVGSRDPEYHGYCSRVCCMTGLKYANEIKSAIPEAYVSNLYIDMLAFGKGCEDFYKKTAEDTHSMFLMYAKGQHPSIRLAGAKDESSMIIDVKEQLSGEEIEIPTDLVVLMVGMEAREDSDAVARLLSISRDKDGWFIESHPKLDPVATTTDGIFIAGACSSPKDIPESISQARAAVARILAKISQGVITVDAVYSEVQDKLCSGCRICNPVCPYSAIEYDAEKQKSRIISEICKACGCCAVACPSGAINARHFNDEQIYAQIEALL
jgi:heterodisulfide reductase subunit A2